MRTKPSIADHSKSTRERIMALVPRTPPDWKELEDCYRLTQHELAASIAMNLECDDMPPDMAERMNNS